MCSAWQKFITYRKVAGEVYSTHISVGQWPPNWVRLADRFHVFRIQANSTSPQRRKIGEFWGGDVGKASRCGIPRDAGHNYDIFNVVATTRQHSLHRGPPTTHREARLCVSVCLWIDYGTFRAVLLMAVCVGRFVQWAHGGHESESRACCFTGYLILVTNRWLRGCLFDRANIELAQAGLLEPRPWLKCRHRLRLLAHSWSRVI